MLINLAAAALWAVAAAALWKTLRGRKQTPTPEVPEQQETTTPEAPPQWPPTEWDRRFMAFHEAGHAVASQYLPERPPLLRITISPSDEAFGMIRTEEKPHHNETRTSLSSTMAVLLAGRIAEELFLHEITTSCVHDLAAAKQLAADMVLKLGMGESSGLTLPPEDLPQSEYILRQRDADIQKLLADAACAAADVLKAHADEVAALAERLLRDGTLDGEEIGRFFRSGRLPVDRADAGH